MYSRYLEYSEPALRAHNLAVVENEQKDALISTLKTDLYELKQLEGEYLRLNDQITALEDKYSLLLEEKDRSEKEQRYRWSYAESKRTSTRTASSSCGQTLMRCASRSKEYLWRSRRRCEKTLH